MHILIVCFTLLATSCALGPRTTWIPPSGHSQRQIMVDDALCSQYATTEAQRMERLGLAGSWIAVIGGPQAAASDAYARAIEDCARRLGYQEIIVP